jgi:hypothetical protein
MFPLCFVVAPLVGLAKAGLSYTRIRDTLGADVPVRGDGRRAVPMQHNLTSVQRLQNFRESVAARKLYRVDILHYFFLYFSQYSQLDSMLPPFIILEYFQDRLKWLKIQLLKTY